MIAARILALVTVALAAACSGPEGVSSVVLTPETPEVEAVLRAADQRWEAAGVAPERIQIGPGGAPVRLVPERAPAAETRTIGRGSEYVGVRWMELYSLDEAVALHELGHVLGINAIGFVRHPFEGSECDVDPSDRPLMCAHVGNRISDQDLELACSAGDCTQFAPELLLE